MWIKKKDHNELVQELKKAKDKIKELEDDKGITILKRLKDLAKECGIDIHDEEYQAFMNRMFMSMAGRESKTAKAYSAAAFLKDNPEELLQRLKKWQKDASIITKEIEDKRK